MDDSTERRSGHSRLVYDKAKRTIVTVTTSRSEQTEAMKEKARAALRRGTPVGQPIRPCSCFSDTGLLRDCSSACEEAVDFVAAALASVHAEAVAAERERCAKIAEQVAREWKYHRAIELARAIREPDRQQGE